MGTAIGQRGWDLVYGGGKVGLMGAVATAALQAGAKVTGIIPATLMQREVGYEGLTELIVVDNMHQRKQAMAERANAFIALPGGVGTFEELFEVWTWRQLGYHGKPIGLLNVAGYYNAFLQFMQQTVDADFVSTTVQSMLHVADTVPGLLNPLTAEMAQGEQVAFQKSWT
jgi:uncharacterized protein (TIGR00730 family)